MREIVFRGKRVDNSAWIGGEYVSLHDDKGRRSYRIYTGYAESDCEDMYPDWFEVDPHTVGQYIGLRDKSGVRIFEGDILRWEFEGGDPEIAEVTWRDDGHEGVGWYIRSIRPIPGLDILCSGDSEWEIIGNIYDNPELLEEKPHETD